MNINKVCPESVSDIFKADSDTIYEIPNYQREYKWGVKEWEDLFNDINENDKGYFLGTIICINSSDDIQNKYEIVDGQQRLITLSIFLASIYKTFLDNKNLFTREQEYSDIMPLKDKLIINKTKEIRIIPQDQCNNREDFKDLITREIIFATDEIIFEKKIKPFKASIPHAGNRRIEKAYNHFRKCIDAVLNMSSDKASELFKIRDKVYSAIFVRIEVSNHADAYTLFESLNDRGTPLTSVDLIKNILLARLDRIGVGNIDHYFSRWKEILSNLGENPTDHERFFRQNYNAFRKSLNAPFCKEESRQQYPLGSIATRTTMLDIYEKIITKDPISALDDLFENSAIYAEIISPPKETLSDMQYECYLNLQRVQGTPSYLFIMYILKYQNTLEINNKDIIDICKFLVNFFIRRNMTDTPPTYDLTRIFMSLIDEIEKNNYRGIDIYSNMHDKLKSLSVSDEIFEEKLRGPVYKINFDATRFILCMMAKEGMTRETAQDLWQKHNKQYIWSIEHIFPQGKDIPDYWVDMIADGDRKKAIEYQETEVHTLGNLTLTAYNSTLSNANFNKKKELRNEKGQFIGYRNGLNLNKDVSDKDKWTIQNIHARTDRMVKEIIAIFKLD